MFSILHTEFQKDKKVPEEDTSKCNILHNLYRNFLAKKREVIKYLYVKCLIKSLKLILLYELYFYKIIENVSSTSGFSND